jgi:hypothetical protein
MSIDKEDLINPIYVILGLSGRGQIYRVECKGCGKNSDLKMQEISCPYCGDSELSFQYLLQLTICTANTQETVVVFDEIAKRLVGMDAREFSRLLQKSPDAATRLNNHLSNLICRLKLKGAAKTVWMLSWCN